MKHLGHQHLKPNQQLPEYFSTPNRLIILFEGIDAEIHRQSEEIRGPSIRAPEKALEGFIKSNKIEKKIFSKIKLKKENSILLKNQQKKLKL